MNWIIAAGTRDVRGHVNTRSAAIRHRRNPSELTGVNSLHVFNVKTTVV